MEKRQEWLLAALAVLVSDADEPEGINRSHELVAIC